MALANAASTSSKTSASSMLNGRSALGRWKSPSKFCSASVSEANESLVSPVSSSPKLASGARNLRSSPKLAS